MPVFAEFVLSAAAAHQFPADALPEVALVGRSNVGKSSMVNSLLRMNKLARTSNTPGRTQTLNFYRIWPEGKPKLGDPGKPDPEDRFTLKGAALQAAIAGDAFYFVDMPGYGYAKVSETQKRAWRKLIEQYLIERPTLQAVIQLVDLRHPPSKEDVEMWTWLAHHDHVRLCLATKADKVPKPQRIAHSKEVASVLGIPWVAPVPGGHVNLSGTESFLLYSADEGLGREALWNWVLSVTQGKNG